MNRTLAVTLAGCFLATSLHAQFTDIPNSIKYSDTGKPNAKGRSGSASIEARALMGRDGATELVVTTGSLESAAAAPGNIEKVQVKHATADVTRNFNGLTSGGVFSQSLTGLHRYEAIQVQANVSGIDPSRTDVVTVTETVKLRPDLVLWQLQMPAHAAVGVPFQINALVEERYGDTGARANCVLYQGNVEVDRANNIWVDAGSSVTCQLRHTLHTVGMQELTVAIESVNPGDYEPENNIAGGSVQVYASATAMPQWYSGANDESWEYKYSVRSPMQEIDTDESGWSTMSSFSAQFVNRPEIYDGLRLSYEESTDGRQTVYVGDAQWWNMGSCSMAWEQGATIEKCLLMPGWHGPSEPIVTIYISRGGGAATYRSHGWYMAYNWSENRWDRYTLNRDTTYAYGLPRVDFGNTVAMTVRASDGTTLWEATPFMTMNASTTEYVQPWRCFTDWSGMESCSSSLYRRTGRVGSDYSE